MDKMAGRAGLFVVGIFRNAPNVGSTSFFDVGTGTSHGLMQAQAQRGRDTGYRVPCIASPPMFRVR